MQEKTGAVIKLPGDLQLEILLAAQILTELTDILSPFLSLMTLSLHLEIWKLTKLPENWSG